MKSMKANQHASPLWRILIPGITLLLLTACSGGGGGGDPGAGSDDPGTTIDKNASVSARSASLALGDADCPHGGILVETGIDENGNGVLDDNEVDAVEKVCNGAPGSDGADGRDGLDSLVAFSDEPPGANCPWGGMKVESGLDANRDGILQPGEVNETSFVCSLVDGAIGWQVGEVLSFRNADSPALAVAENGSAIAVWRQRDYSDTRWDLWASRYHPVDGWGIPTVIETADGDVSDPAIAITLDGWAIVVWRQRDASGTRWDLWTNHCVPSFGKCNWDGPTLLENDNGEVAAPAIAMAPDGSSIVIWAQQGGLFNVRWDLWARRFVRDSDGWRAPDSLEAADANVRQGEYDIAMAPDGSALAAWRQWDGSRDAIQVSHYDPLRDSWSDAQSIGDANTDGGFPSVALAADGSAIVTWINWDGASDVLLQANRYHSDSGWGGALFLGYDGPGDIAIYPDGRAIAIWPQLQSRSAFTSDIVASHYNPAFGWDSWPLPIEKRQGGAEGFSKVAIAPDGSALALWSQRDGTRMAIWSNRFVPGAGWGVAQPVERNAAGNAYAPQIGFDGGGNAIAVWRQRNADDTRWEIWAARWIAPWSP